MHDNEITYFRFRIINTEDGNQVIRSDLKTPYNSLTPLEMVEYTEIDKQLVYMERIKKREKREAYRQRKIARNPFYRLACLCGIA